MPVLENDALLVENKAAASGLPASATRYLLARRIIPKSGTWFSDNMRRYKETKTAPDGAVFAAPVKSLSERCRRSKPHAG